MKHNIETLTIKELFKNDRYRIPIYQRNYAWGRSEISQLIQDIIDYIPENRNYYIGTLVVYPQELQNSVVFDTIDGQQRLTTLSILLSVLKNDFNEVSWYDEIILSFESRPLSQTGLEFCYDGKFNGSQLYHNTIKEAYYFIKNDLDVKLREYNIPIEKFTDFLSQYVTILRVEVPADTDLNHYFEIMNNRGEQLEKHEVVKALLLDALYDDKAKYNKQKQELFHLIWDACSQMERYLQFSFDPKLRIKLFGKDWSELKITSYNDLLSEYIAFKGDALDKEYLKFSIDDIVNGQKRNKSANNNPDVSDRFTSPINFQNFLLQILRVQTSNNEYALDDKRLIDFFRKELRHKTAEEKKTFATEFLFNLLKGKWLLDTYIIKRQFLANKEGWSVLKLKTKDGSKGYYVNTFGDDNNWDNEYIVMLLSMFHVSTPTMIYKHWLNAALYYLFNEDNITAESYRLHLEMVAKQLICFRFLNPDAKNKLDYFTLTYNNAEISKEFPIIQYDNKLLTYGCIENNLIFNFLDYIIWCNSDEEVVANFEFTFRSSVEHYYPQNPIGGKPLNDQNVLNSFGNLCLISHQKNSKLNHHLPSAKKNYYAKLDSGGHLSFDSLKQYIMMSEYDADIWNENSINDHQKKMVDLLNDFIQN
jgi:hypothetical protein